MASLCDAKNNNGVAKQCSHHENSAKFSQKSFFETEPPTFVLGHALL
jgi:uncharacterized membrane protein